jgi:hypothetical protein
MEPLTLLLEYNKLKKEFLVLNLEMLHGGIVVIGFR